MAFKPNYHQERSNRNRSKEQKKQEKLRRLQEASARRKEEAAGADPVSFDNAPDLPKPEVE